jgi:hypothetical protein
MEEVPAGGKFQTSCKCLPRSHMSETPDLSSRRSQRALCVHHTCARRKPSRRRWAKARSFSEQKSHHRERAKGIWAEYWSNRLRLRSFNLKDCRHVNASPPACIVPDDHRLEFFDVRPAHRTEADMLPGLDFEPLAAGKENRKRNELESPVAAKVRSLNNNYSTWLR